MATILSVIISKTDAVIINQTQFSHSAVSTNITKEGPIIKKMVKKNETIGVEQPDHFNESKMVGNTRELISKGAVPYPN